MTYTLWPWLLTDDHDHQWPWSVINDHQDTHPWPSERSPMSTLCLSCGQLTWTVWWVSMMSTVTDTSSAVDTSTLIDTFIVHEESMREWVRVCESGVWYPLIKMTEMTKEGQRRLWWYFLNIVCFLVFLRIGVCVWVLSGVYLVCVLSGVGGWYKRRWEGKWVAPAILGD